MSLVSRAWCCALFLLLTTATVFGEATDQTVRNGYGLAIGALNLIPEIFETSSKPLLPGGEATSLPSGVGKFRSLKEAAQAARYAVVTSEAGALAGQAGGCFADNPAHELRCRFQSDGLELQPIAAERASWRLNLRLRGHGRETIEAAEVNAVNARQNRVELTRAGGAVVEWYENRQTGLEQGFTVERAPAGVGPLRLVLQAEGDLRPELDLRSGDSEERRHPVAPGEEVRRSTETPLREQVSEVQFVSADGHAVLRYSGLKVWDAAQRELAAHIEVQGRELTLVVDDRDAAYPVTVDPLITRLEAELRPETTGLGGGMDNFGNSVALSSDGSTALIGAGNDRIARKLYAGSAYLFIRNGNGWTLQAKLTGSDFAVHDHFGSSVSISADGNTALVGSPDHDQGLNTNAGVAYVFVRNGTNWYEQTKLAASDNKEDSHFGFAVSLSADGNTALIGAVGDDTSGGTNAGSAHVFKRDGTNWLEQTKLTASDGVTGDMFGYSVSLSTNGEVALVGAPDHDVAAETNAGSAYVFVRNGVSWIPQAELVADDGVADDWLGCSVSLSGDGNTVLVGARGRHTSWDTKAGGAYVFLRAEASWSQQHKLTADDGVLGASFGASVALSADGVTGLVGAREAAVGTNIYQGCAYAFQRSGSGWSQPTRLTAGDGQSYSSIGDAVALSADGSVALVGASNDDTDAGFAAGSVYMFIRSGVSWTQEAHLSAGNGGDDSYFGGAVSLSADGNTALVGASWEYSTTTRHNAGSAYVLIRDGGSWHHQARLTGDDTYLFGAYIALSGDGCTALVGAYRAYNEPREGETGSAYVFVRNGSTWIRQAKLTEFTGAVRGVLLSRDGHTALVTFQDSVTNTVFANSIFTRNGSTWTEESRLSLDCAIALSGDGNTVLAGFPNETVGGRTNVGSGGVYSRNGKVWSRTATLTAGDSAANAYFGTITALSEDGRVALLASARTNIYVFVSNGSVWQQQAKLTVSDGGYFPSAVLSGDGNAVLLGSVNVYGDQGCGYLFLRSGDTWNQVTKLTAPDGAQSDGFGQAIALSRDGETALMGACWASSPTGDSVGAAYVFRFPELAQDYNRQTAELLGGGGVRLTHRGLAGTNYVLDRTFSLTPPVVWIPRATNFAGSDARAIFTDTPNPTTNNFWRVRSVP